MEASDGYGVVEEGCTTPRHDGCRIVAASVCPRAPRKRRVYNMKQKQRSLPKDGYFQPPELELFFASMPKREPYVPLQACLDG